MKSKAKFTQAHEDPRQIEAAKTSRLRALRLAKEAAEKVAVPEPVARPAKSSRVRAASKKPAASAKAAAG